MPHPAAPCCSACRGRLWPAVDARYATPADRAHTHLTGSSIGGLTSLDGLCGHPPVFGGAGGISTHWIGGFERRAAGPSAGRLRPGPRTMACHLLLLRGQRPFSALAEAGAQALHAPRGGGPRGVVRWAAAWARIADDSPLAASGRRREPHWGRRLAATLSAGVLVLAPAWAGTVYRWVDDAGRVHYGEQVPERYRAQARTLDAPANAPTAEQQREAMARAQRDKERAAALAAARAASAASAARPPASAASTPPAKRPAQRPDERTDCATWQRLYQESLDCFGPYRTVRGAVKPEAFERCNEVPEPPATRCRPRLP